MFKFSTIFKFVKTIIKQIFGEKKCSTENIAKFRNLQECQKGRQKETILIFIEAVPLLPHNYLFFTLGNGFAGKYIL